MTIPLMLCTLIALTSGVHFGKEFAAAHRARKSMIVPVLAHVAVSATLMILSVLLDESDKNMLWMIVATASLGGLALGTLLPVSERQAQPAQAAPVAPVSPAKNESLGSAA